MFVGLALINFTPDSVVVDSNLTFSQAIKGTSATSKQIDRLALVTVTYVGYDGRKHRGQIIIEKSLETEIRSIFEEIERSQFPIARVTPVVVYGWSDDASTKANNTSGFNYRSVEGTSKLSAHARGRAIDLNPWVNPWMKTAKRLGQTYDPKVQGTLTAQSSVVKAFKSKGWKWGGDWKRHKDYQHFEKP